MPEYDYPRPSLTADIVVLARDRDAIRVLLIERRNAPFEGLWALPGGFVDEGEDLDHAALRELAEETGLRGIALEQIGAFGTPGRDPRGWVVTVAFLGLVSSSDVQVRAASDAVRAQWFAFDALPPLAFDHDEIIAAALSSAARLDAASRN